MSEEAPRRVKNPPPDAPTGYRSTKRASKAFKHAKRAERQHEMSTALGRITRTVRNIGYYSRYSSGCCWWACSCCCSLRARST